MALTWPPSGTDVAIGLAAFLLAWYVVGLHLNRRRGGQLVRQVRDSLLPLQGAATIRWIGRSAFRVEVEQLRPPMTRLGVSVLLEPRETFLLWLIGRLRGRRDWLVLSAILDTPLTGAFELYDPRRRGAHDSAQRAKLEGWKAEPVPGCPSLLLAGKNADSRALARALVGQLRGVELWGLALYPAESRLKLSLPVPVAETRTPLPVFAHLPQLAETVVARARKP